ncbi:MAG TPA: TrkA family potassium uptake protein [Clostridia bacterium]|nr:TrkA family potassium uptake protein [Clostridia bacterium]HXK71107.1 TrkA family potassium uptake protein [Clostridia bacterium]
MKSVLIIGTGKFGKNLALKMAELGNEVMVVDKEENEVRDISEYVTSAQVADCMDENVLRSLGINNFDICFVCIGDNFQSSLEITSLLKDNGAKYVVSKADRDIHAKFLLRNGADEVIFPEKDMAQRAAYRFSANHMFDYIQLSQDYSICEIETPENWVGKTIAQVNVRSNYNVNVLAYKENGKIYPLSNPNYIFKENTHLIISGAWKDVEKLNK